jgi:hypothetical protein
MEVWQKERTGIWVPTTRRLKLLVQGILWVILILLWVQGSSFCGCGYGCGCGSSHNCAAHTALLSLPYDSTNYAGPVSPLLTLVVLPEAGFITLPLDWTSSSTPLINSHGRVRVVRAAHVLANVGWCEELEPFEALMGPGCLESRLTESPVVTHCLHVCS